MKSPQARQMPDAFVILFFIVLLAAISSYLVPAGWFAMTEIIDSAGNTVKRIDPQQFFIAQDTAHHVSLFSSTDKTGLVNFAFDGMTSGDRMGSAVGVVAFILIVGGAFGVVTVSYTHLTLPTILRV